MGSHDDPRSPADGRSGIVSFMLIGIAEGILVERYQVPLEQAKALLESRATQRGLSLHEAANWLVTSNALP
jgi:hypothetical protein